MKRGSAWPISVVVILGASVVANFWLLRIANSDPSVAITADYYQKAVHWDDELAQRKHNDDLGWRLTPALAPGARDHGSMLDVSLRDRDGAPLAGARIAVVAVHNTMASRPEAVTLSDEGAGRYQALLPVARRGLWELRFDVYRDGEHFTADLRVDEGRGP